MKKWHWIALSLLTVLSIIAEFTMHHDPSHTYSWSGIPLFWIWFGFIGCVLLIYFAKVLLVPIVYKKEDYYND